jgi:hypothetical protein
MKELRISKGGAMRVLFAFDRVTLIDGILAAGHRRPGRKPRSGAGAPTTAGAWIVVVGIEAVRSKARNSRLQLGERRG